MNTNMNYQTPVWRLALGGVIAGAVFFFIPFALPLIGLILLGGLFFWLVSGGRKRRMHMAMAWQNMSDEKRMAMRLKFRHHRCGPGHMPTGKPANTNTNE